MNVFMHQNYEEYVSAQRSLTAKRTHNGRNIVTWVSEEMLGDINKVLHTCVSDIKTIVCHGCRNGFEVNVFQYLNPDAKVFGTDLYGSAYKWDRNYFREMDFDTVPQEWKEYFDVVYSNAIDHSRNPFNTLFSWKSELKENGICFIAFQFTRRKVNEGDCFNLSTRKYRSEIEFLAKETGMRMVYCSEPSSINHRRGYYVNVILKKL